MAMALPANPAPSLKFVALGGIWLDEICTPGKEALVDVPGGSVAFATFGALLFSLDAPKAIGLIVKTGHDFPASLEQTFTQWNLDLHIVRENDRPSPRGRILYGEDASDRKYQRLTPPMPSTVEDVRAANMTAASCFHFFDTPAAVADQIDHITALRMYQGWPRTCYVWEPQAKLCNPFTLRLHKHLVDKVDIFSPNHAELASFFTNPTSSAGVFDKGIIEQQARAFLPAKIPHPLCVLIRCAEHGCLVLSATPMGEEKTAWLPPYHLPGSTSVIDPTGAGNAFLGGAAMGYLEHGDFLKAAAYGSVAASFAVETVGLPDVQKCGVKARLEDYVSRLGMALG